MMKVYETPGKEVLEAMAQLSGNPLFQRILDWTSLSLAIETQRVIDEGDDVARGHCQALSEFLAYAASHVPRETLGK